MDKTELFLKGLEVKAGDAPGDDDLKAKEFETGRVSSRRLRAYMKMCGKSLSGPSFYHLASELEDEKLINGLSIPMKVEGEILKFRFYELEDNGRRRLRELEARTGSREELGGLGGLFSPGGLTCKTFQPH